MTALHALLDQLVLGLIFFLIMFMGISDDLRETFKSPGHKIMWALFAFLWITVGTWARFYYQWPLIGIWGYLFT